MFPFSHIALAYDVSSVYKFYIRINVTIFLHINQS